MAKKNAMKKLLEVLQYRENDIRFNTDIDVEKNPGMISGITLNSAMAMATKLWGGKEQSVLAVIRALILADLACSVNRKQMIRMMDEESRKLAKAMNEAVEAFRANGGTVMTFGPGTAPSKTKS